MDTTIQLAPFVLAIREGMQLPIRPARFGLRRWDWRDGACRG
jgi:hypothetical protein